MSTHKNHSLLPVLIIFTVVFVAAQISFLLIKMITSDFFETAISNSLTYQIVFSTLFLKGVLGFLISQLLLYSMLVFLVWYVSQSCIETFQLKKFKSLVAIAILFIIFTWILSTNYLYVPHSFYSMLIQGSFSSPSYADIVMQYCFVLSSFILGFTFILSTCRLIYKFKSIQKKDSLFIILLCLPIIAFAYQCLEEKVIASAHQFDKPNIILIGIDALRPDFIGFNNKAITTTPTIDNFLRNSVSFNNAYTPLARTFPSWTSILTGLYPKHNNARGNNTAIANLNLENTLPKILKHNGYETIYATDDTRFNNTNEAFGFNRIVTPPMGLNDFLIGTFNDFPLSNIFIPTALGKFLFPYNYANHGAYLTYKPSNFLNLISKSLQQRKDKPLFLAVHFTITHWPFYWFNDKLPSFYNESYRYQSGIAEADHQVSQFLSLLEKSNLLKNTIVILLSDHGTALGLKGDRVIDPRRYHGNQNNINQMTVMRYSSAFKDSLDYHKDYGIDTCYGYGGDILSKSQSHSLLAFKGFGFSLGKNHTVNNPVLLTDITPTLLDLLNLPPLPRADGVSLKNVLLNTNPISIPTRPMFFETSFTLDEIQREGISVDKVLAKTVRLFQMDPKTGLIFLKPEAEKGMNLNKQFAVSQNGWLLARLPETIQSRLSFKTNSFINTILPPRWVLVNTFTGDWTLEMDSDFAKQSPYKVLKTQLFQFYGKEIKSNHNKT